MDWERMTDSRDIKRVGWAQLGRVAVKVKAGHHCF